MSIKEQLLGKISRIIEPDGTIYEVLPGRVPVPPVQEHSAESGEQPKEPLAKEPSAKEPSASADGQATPPTVSKSLMPSTDWKIRKLKLPVLYPTGHRR